MTPTDERLEKLQNIAAQRQKGFVLVLENIHDPHNAAAICRSADSFGVQEIWLICETVPEWDLFELGKKSSAFTSRWLSFRTFQTTVECIEALQEEQYKIWSTMLDEAAESLMEADFTATEKIALVMGNEHEGVSETIAKASDKKLYIPMTGFAQSFNVSVATASAFGRCIVNELDQIRISSSMTRNRKPSFRLSTKNNTKRKNEDEKGSEKEWRRHETRLIEKSAKV